MFVIFAGMLSVLVALVWESLVSGLSFRAPGMYIVHARSPEQIISGPSLEKLGIMQAIDSFLCFLLIGGSGLTLIRHRKKRQSISTGRDYYG